MFDFQLDIFETVMRRFKSPLERIATSDVDIESFQDGEEYHASFHIMATDKRCHMCWVPRKYLIFDAYYALTASEFGADSIRVCGDLFQLLKTTASAYGLEYAVVDVPTDMLDRVVSSLCQSGFEAEDSARGVYVVHPVPMYYDVFTSSFENKNPEAIKRAALNMVHKLPRVCTDVAVHNKVGRTQKPGISRMSLG